jgi:hypothetical protein
MGFLNLFPTLSLRYTVRYNYLKLSLNNQILSLTANMIGIIGYSKYYFVLELLICLVISLKVLNSVSN